jgi:hypothetical protein
MKNACLLSILGLLWGLAPVEAQNTNLNRLFSFDIPGATGNIPPYTPYKVIVNLKTDFSGTVKFYSCDKAKFRLLDIGNAEYAENVTYDVNAKPGPIAKFDAEFYGIQSGTQPLICGEYSGTNQLKGTKYAAAQTNRQIFRPEIDEDWYDTNLLDAIALSDPFAQARTKKLLTNYYPPEKAKSILPDLVAWIIKGDRDQKAENAFKMIVSQYGGKEAAEALRTLLKDSAPDKRRKAIELLSFCGKDADIASNDLQELLLTEKEGYVLRDAILLAKNRGFEIPAKYLNAEDISADKAASYIKEIKAVCDFAASIDLSRKEEFPRDYDDEGKRLPIPKDAKKAIDSLEDLIARMPNYPEMARAYLLLGMLKQRFMDNYQADVVYEDPNDKTRYNFVPPKEIKKYAETEYLYGEPGATYFYNSYHFNRLVELFPDSEFADDAAFEKAGEGFGGECESDENCPLEVGTDYYRKFLKGYPSSNLAGKAIDAINKAFKSITGSKERRIYKTEYFSLDAFKTLVNDYQEAVEDVALPEKSRAYDTICTLWEKAGEPEKAAQACNFILENYPTYPTIDDVRLRAQNFKSIDFRLKAPIAVGYRSVYLEWAPVNNAISYTIYRASTNSEDFSEIQLLSGTTSFQDKNITPSASYKYYIDAITSNGTKLTSDTLFTDIPSIKGDAYRDLSEPTFERMTFFNEEDRNFYIFTYIYNSRHEPFPEITKVSEDGKDVEHFSGLFYGYADSPLNKFTDNTLLIDPTHQKFLRFPKDIDFEKSIKVIHTQNMEFIPDSYQNRKWKPTKGRHLVSISQDSKSAWLIGISTDHWTQNDSLVWDSANNICWEVRAGTLIQYKSQDPTQAIPLITLRNRISSPVTIHPDEKEGALWAVNTGGGFFKIDRNGQIVTRFDTNTPIWSGNQIAFNTEKNYAWIMTLYNNADMTKLRKISLKDGSLITEVNRGEYIYQGDQPRNLSMPMSIDWKTENLWIYNATDHKLIKLSPTGKNILTKPI